MDAKGWGSARAAEAAAAPCHCWFKRRKKKKEKKKKKNGVSLLLFCWKGCSMCCCHGNRDHNAGAHFLRTTKVTPRHDFQPPAPPRRSQHHLRRHDRSCCCFWLLLAIFSFVFFLLLYNLCSFFLLLLLPPPPPLSTEVVWVLLRFTELNPWRKPFGGGGRLQKLGSRVGFILSCHICTAPGVWERWAAEVTAVRGPHTGCCGWEEDAGVLPLLSPAGYCSGTGSPKGEADLPGQQNTRSSTIKENATYCKTLHSVINSSKVLASVDSSAKPSANAIMLIHSHSQ